ncbi:MAG: hypothetical protein IEMM0008_0519 [bacterium]|nr:MAG: hypothetical protein IEMM0008_0519 [bacterium]
MLRLIKLFKNKDFDSLRDFFREMENSDDMDQISKICFYALENIKEGDPVFIPMTCLNHLKRIVSPEIISKLKTIYPKLPKLIGINDYRTFYYEFIKIYENQEKGSPCHCILFEEKDVNPYGNKNLEPYRKAKEKDYVQTDYLKCKICKRKWKIVTTHGYHTPSSTWKEMK